ncbi:hypothetical protein [Taibaiella chishuiensis]|uniref:Uncharacterized protein n=1 Tax=Taibaiella chishuiensis TaxID=1434707 RepID=A0A2P8D0C3_9BACT|nr:hypothetical protein [Taibaiella chishuiensis]PSK90669.1 hypothetical protein B0I18_10779 [Taibaiella chishuiensis]
MIRRPETERQKIIDEFLDWLDAHRHNLPVNASTWTFQLVEKRTVAEQELVTLGKYNAQKARSIPFYKPYTKIFKF